MKRTTTEALESKYPAMVRKARTGSAKSAIRLFCLECLGESPGDVKTCTDTICWVWPFRMGNGFEDPGLPIPEKAELTDKQRATIKKMHAARG